MVDKTIERISITTLIIVILFEILRYIPEDKTYDSFVFETALNLISTIFFKVGLGFFLVYITLVAIKLGHGKLGKLVSSRMLNIAYNISILVTLMIIILTVVFGLIITIIAPLSIPLASNILIIFIGIILLDFVLMFVDTFLARE